MSIYLRQKTLSFVKRLKAEINKIVQFQSAVIFMHRNIALRKNIYFWRGYGCSHYQWKYICYP